MAFDLDDDELEATRKLHGVGKEKIADEIKVGEYVRLRGEILQVSHIGKNYFNDKLTSLYITFKEYASGNSFSLENIKKWKHSFNIIDLIEVGDYVNGDKVVNKNDDRRELVLRNDTGFQYINEGNSNEIKSIVTKEQFKSNEYIVKE